jgi:proline iminopeptidase
MLFPVPAVLGALPVFSVAAALLHRKLRQHTIAAALRIHNTNGIAEECYVPIGGIEQRIGIRGEDRFNPVLLIVHGGPGASCSIFTPRIRAWEKHFTIVQWDQRGSGKTLGRSGERATGVLTLDRLTRDGIEVAEYLRRRLEITRMILMGQSFGSTFALSMLKRRPDLFSAYVGTDQNIGMVRDRDEVLRATLQRLRAARLNKGVGVLERIGPYPSRWTAEDYLAVAKWTMKSDPPTCLKIMKLLKDSVWYSPEYSLRDIGHFSRGMHFSLEQLLPDAVRFDAWQESTRFDVPFFVFQGENDVLTSPSLAEAYCNDVTAPVKGFALIRNAGHFAAFLQPDQFLTELLARVRPLVTTCASVSAATPG